MPETLIFLYNLISDAVVNSRVGLWGYIDKIIKMNVPDILGNGIP